MTNTYGTSSYSGSSGSGATDRAPIGGSLAGIGGIIAAIGIFLPILSQGDQSISFWDALTTDIAGSNKTGGYMLIVGIVLLLVAGGLAFAGKAAAAGSVGLIGGIVALLGFLISIGFDNIGSFFSEGDIGFWLILIGCVVGLIGGITAFARK